MITLSETQLYLLTFICSVRAQESYMELHASHISQEFKRVLNNFLKTINVVYLEKSLTIL